MGTDQELILGRVAELGAYEGGDRLKATLLPDDEGPPIRLDLKGPPTELAEAIVLGARVGCRAYLRAGARGPVRIAFWIDSVDRREGHDQWNRVWTAPKPFVSRRRDVGPATPPPRSVEEERIDGGTVRRRRTVAPLPSDPPSRAPEPQHAPMGAAPMGAAPPSAAPPGAAPAGAAPARTAPMASAAPRTAAPPLAERPRAPVDIEEGELVTGTLRRLERLANMRTVGTILPEDGGALVELRLRRAPRGLLAALAPGARVHCLAAPHMSDPSLRFSARVVSVDLRDSEGRYREAWRHDPGRERRIPDGGNGSGDDFSQRRSRPPYAESPSREH